ncbi:hypothetical protein GCM10027601_20750 [Nocardioides ungokensis]
MPCAVVRSLVPLGSVIVICVDRIPRAVRELFRELPVPLRHAAIGAVALGITGGIVGLVVGINAYWPTAWAATFELGVPASLLGFALGLVSGSLTYVFRRVHPH